MDDAGNIEPSQAPKQTPDSTVCPEEADVWGDVQDDQDYLESLDDYEKNNGDIPDHLLLKCMADFDSQWKVSLAVHNGTVKNTFLQKRESEETVLLWRQLTLIIKSRCARDIL